MVRTVNEAFNIFLKDYVNLDPDETQLARSSRDWLLDQIRLFPSKDITFPKLYSEKDISFGSFARRTKKRELDDIDIMIAYILSITKLQTDLIGLKKMLRLFYKKSLMEDLLLKTLRENHTAYKLKFMITVVAVH